MKVRGQGWALTGKGRYAHIGYGDIARRAPGEWMIRPIGGNGWEGPFPSFSIAERVCAELAYCPPADLPFRDLLPPPPQVRVRRDDLYADSWMT